MGNKYSAQMEDSDGNVYFMKPDIINTKEALLANTKAGLVPDALLEKELYKNLNDNMGGVRFGITEDGQPGYKKDGADTVYPFNSLNPIKMTLHMNSSFPLWIPFNQRSILIYGNLESVAHYYGVDDTDSRDRSNPLEHTSDGSGNNMITTIPYSRYRYVVIWYASSSTEYRTYRIEWK